MPNHDPGSDPRTAPDDDEDATVAPAGEGRSAPDPAEGADDSPAGGPGSPDG